MRKSPSIEVLPGFYLLMAAGVLILPLRWLFAAIFAAVIHELGHITAIYLCRGKIRTVRVSHSGAAIETAPMERGRGLLCTLAGPVCSLLLIFIFRWFPRLAVCAFAQGVYNLLPIWPLDGGVALRLLLPEPLQKAVSWGTLALVGIGCFYLTLWLDAGILPLIFAFGLLAKKKTLQREAKSITIDLPINSEVRL